MPRSFAVFAGLLLTVAIAVRPDAAEPAASAPLRDAAAGVVRA